MTGRERIGGILQGMGYAVVHRPPWLVVRRGREGYLVLPSNKNNTILRGGGEWTGIDRTALLDLVAASRRHGGAGDTLVPVVAITHETGVIRRWLLVEEAEGLLRTEPVLVSGDQIAIWPVDTFAWVPIEEATALHAAGGDPSIFDWADAR